jgi:hypothetical protein
MTQETTTVTVDPQRAKLWQRQILDSHLFREWSQLVSIGAYQRLPEFREFKCFLTDQQRASVESALGRQLSDQAIKSLQMIIPRVIEHELILVRAPSVAAVVKEIEEFEKRALECLRMVQMLQLTFNDGNQNIARPTFPMEGDAGSFLGPPDAYTAAVNIIRRNMVEPIPAPPELGPLVEVCHALREHYRIKRGPKSNTFVSLYFYVLGRCARASSIKPTLPSKNSFVGAETNRPTAFFTFTRAALSVLQDIAHVALVMDTITYVEREAVIKSLRAFTSLTDEALSDQLAALVKRRIPGLEEFVEAAS